MPLSLDDSELRYLHRLVLGRQKKIEKQRIKLRAKFGPDFHDPTIERARFQRHLLTKIERMLEGE